MKNRISRHSQHGAVFVLVAGFMLLAISFLVLSVDSGRLYLDKRSLQKVADAAALEAAGRLGNCTDALAAAQASAARNNFVHDGSNRIITIRCGNVVSSQGVRDLQDDAELATAVLVTARRTSPASLIAGGMYGDDIELRAEAMASRKGSPLAALTIRSTLLGVSVTNNNEANRLNAMLGSMLGGSVNLSVGAWNGLLHTDINLFEYLDQLAVNLGLSAGQVDQVLSANVSAGTLIQAAIDVIDSKIGTPQATINALDAIVAMDHINVIASISPTTLNVGQMLGVDPDGKYDGAVLNLQLFQLVQGIVQLANSKNFAVAVVPLSIGGNTVEVRTKVIEPPRFSAIGDPFKALSGEREPIYVRTAQVRILLSVTLSSALSTLISNLQTHINNVVNPLSDILNNLFSLNLAGLLNNLLCVGCWQNLTDVRALPAPLRFDINIDVAAGEAEVSAVSCGNGDNRSLTVPVNTSAVTIRIGKMGTSAADAASRVFSSELAPDVEPIPLVDVGMERCQVSCLLGLCSKSNCQARVPFHGGGIALKEERSLLGRQQTLLYESPAVTNLPEIQSLPRFQSISTNSDIVSNLSGSLFSPSIVMYAPSGGGPLSSVLGGVGSLLDSLIGLLQGAVRTVLSPILDPLLNLLILTAGIDLARTDVGANLSCSSETGVQLLR